MGESEKMSKEEEFVFWLACIQGISSSKKRLLQETFGCAKAVYYIEETGRKSCWFLTEKEKAALKEHQKEAVLDERKRVWEKARKKGIKLTYWTDSAYPEKLSRIAQPPYALFGAGKECFAFEGVTAAIVGAREASAYGRQMTYEYGRELAKAGMNIISGMARGIDAAGLEGALLEGKGHCAVLGSGVDVCYPKDNQRLYQRLWEDGRILSEYPPGTPPLARNFPPRNRIISGLADVVLVMEARKRSGSLITADFALEQGKDVYALPGPVTSDLSRGCHQLIRQGAGILVSPEEFLCDLPYKLQKSLIEFCKNPVKNSNENEIMLESPEKLLYSVLSLEPKNIQEIEDLLSLPRGEIMEALLNLEMNGWIQEVSKNDYIRLK